MYKKHDIKLVSPESGDWEALYIDGELATENHKLSVEDVFDALSDIFPHDFDSVTISDEDAEIGMPMKYNEEWYN